MRPESKAKAFEDPKPERTKRVFVVGGSVAQPFSGDGGALFADLFSRLLPGYSLELIGCGMTAYDSARDWLVLREVIDRSPDLIVVLSGNNEYNNAGDPPAPSVLIALRAMRQSRLFRSLQDRLAPRIPPASARGRELRAARFEENLRRMARLARRRGVPLALCTLPANLHDSAPSVGSVVLPLDMRGFFPAWAAYEFGDYKLAERRFRLFANAVRDEPFSHYYRAKALERLGRLEEAAFEYRKAADANDPGERTSPARNAIIRRVAKEEGAILADLELEFARASPHGVPGRAMFRDSCHFRGAQYSRVSGAILDAVYRHDAAGGTPALAAPGEWNQTALGDLPRLSAPRPNPEDDQRSEILQLLGAVGKATLTRQNGVWEEAVNIFEYGLDHNPALVRSFAASNEGLERLFEQPYFREMRPANLDSARPRLLVQLAEAYRRKGRLEEALPLYDAALAADPTLYPALVGRAVSLARLGRRSDARAAFLRLRKAYPDLREPRFWLAYLKLDDGL